MGGPGQVAPGIKKLPKEKGAKPTGMVDTTEFVAVLITETLFDALFATINKLPSGFTDIPQGTSPTAMVATTEFVAVFITDTEAALELVT